MFASIVQLGKAIGYATTQIQYHLKKKEDLYDTFHDRYIIYRAQDKPS